jgi:hypothetical protein
MPAGASAWCKIGMWIACSICGAAFCIVLVHWVIIIYPITV